MTGERDLLALCDRLLSFAKEAGAGEAEAVAASSISAETALEKGDIHIPQSATETSFGLRVYVGERLGFVTSNDTRDAALREQVADAVAQARVAPPDPLGGLPDPRSITAVAGLQAPALRELSVADTVKLAAGLIQRVESRDKRVRIDSGSVSVSSSASAIASTRGVRASESEDRADCYLFGMAVEGEEVASFDYDSDTTRDADALAAVFERTADRFVDKCRAGLGARKGESFRGAAVLSPEAVCELLLPGIVSSVTADSVRKGRSLFAGKLGEAVAAASFTLVDDATVPGAPASSAFDREGIPTARLAIIDAGVLRSFLWNHYEARASGNGAQSTGHASGGVGSLPGVGPSCLEILAGDRTAADLLAPDTRAILVNRFSGSTNPVTGDFSGVVKNGSLLGPSGPTAVKETMIAGNLFALLKGISALSRERRLVGGSRRVPYIRVEDISVTAG